MSVDRVIASYLRLAKEDLGDAVVLEGRGSGNAVYHLEQAAEKLTRAVLTSEGKHGGVGHQLHAMIDQIPDENPVKLALRAIEAPCCLRHGVPVSDASRPRGRSAASGGVRPRCEERRCRLG
jgi:HEPN domain-containing protein